jgi:hypothetical protein
MLILEGPTRSLVVFWRPLCLAYQLAHCTPPLEEQQKVARGRVNRGATPRGFGRSPCRAVRTSAAHGAGMAPAAQEEDPDAMPLIATVSDSALPITGSRRLLYAILADLFALRELTPSAAVRRQRLQDEQWLASEQAGPFTFLWVCQQLEISPLVTKQQYQHGGHAPSKERRPGAGALAA